MLRLDRGARENVAPSANGEVRHQKQVGRRRRRASRDEGVKESDFPERERSPQWWLVDGFREGKCKRTGRRGHAGPQRMEAPNMEKQLGMERFQASLLLNLETKVWN